MRADSSDIVDHKLKLILGLIWTLILHYSISMPVWEDDERAGKEEQTPKQRLLGWVQNKQPDKPVSNFTTDWNDGRAIGALVDGIAPGGVSNPYSSSTYWRYTSQIIIIIIIIILTIILEMSSNNVLETSQNT